MSQPLPQPTSPTTPAAPGLPATAPAGRPSWSGLLQLSLVNIPLKAYAAVRTRDVPTAHLLHAGCGQRLRYAKHCPRHGPVDAAAVVKGYEDVAQMKSDSELTSLRQRSDFKELLAAVETTASRRGK